MDTGCVACQKVPVTGKVPPVPVTSQAVVLAVLPGCTVHVPDCAAWVANVPALVAAIVCPAATFTVPITLVVSAAKVACTANVPTLVTSCDGTEANETGRVVIAAAPSDNLTKTGVPTGASIVSEPPLSSIERTPVESEAIVTLSAVASSAAPIGGAVPPQSTEMLFPLSFIPTSSQVPDWVTAAAA